MFRHEGAKAIARYRRLGEPFSVLLLGTEEEFSGDPLANTNLAQLLAKAARQEDTPCHLEGRWFAVILSGADQAGARAALERIRSATSWQPGQPPSASPMGGVATWTPEYDHLDQLLGAAREHMTRYTGERNEQAREWRHMTR